MNCPYLKFQGIEVGWVVPTTQIVTQQQFFATNR